MSHIREGYEDRLTEPFVNVVPYCLDEGGMSLDVASSAGTYVIKVNDQVVGSWTVGHDNLSELGLYSEVLYAASGGNIEITGNGEVMVSSTACVPDSLPFTGLADGLMVAGVLLMGLGISILARFKKVV